MKNKFNYRKKFSQLKKNFILGFGSVLNIQGSKFDFSNYLDDSKSLRSDWESVGKDFNVALSLFSNKTENMKGH